MFEKIYGARFAANIISALQIRVFKEELDLLSSLFLVSLYSIPTTLCLGDWWGCDILLD